MATATATPAADLSDAIRSIADNLPAAGRDKAQDFVQSLASGGTFGDAFGIDQERMEAVYSVAHTMYGNGKYEDAVTMFRFLSMMDYSDIRFWMGLGATQQMLGDYQDAVQAYAYATVLDIDDPKPQLQAGYCLMQVGEYEAAQTALEGALLAENLTPEIEIQAEAIIARIESLLDADS